MLAAGTYLGPVGRLPQRVVSRQGAGIRESIADQYLRGAGLATRGGIHSGVRVELGALGDPNLCTDPGWQVAQFLTGAAGAITQAAAGSDQGWQQVGTGVTGVADSWASVCRAQAAGAGTTTPTAGVTSYTDSALAAALAAQQAQAQQDQIRVAQQQAMQAQQQQQQTQTLLIGGGVLAVALVIGGVLLLRK